MNATEFERELNKLTEDLAEKYIKLRDLERAGYKDEKLMDMLFYGHVASILYCPISSVSILLSIQ